MMRQVASDFLSASPLSDGESADGDVDCVAASRPIRPTADCHGCAKGVSVSAKTHKLIYRIYRFCKAMSEYSPISV